jgi:hypothetical protein
MTLNGRAKRSFEDATREWEHVCTENLYVPKTSSELLRVGVLRLFSGRLSRQQPKIVIGMLEIILRFDSIPGCRRSTGQRQIAIETGLGMGGSVGTWAFDP